LTTTAFTGDIPGHYHSGLGPLLFEPYAAEVAARAAVLRPRRVLETACGTGIVTRHLRGALHAETSIVATDLNDAMIAVARRVVPSGVEFRPADMTALPFSDGAFDLVVCQFGLMFVPDKALAARETRRVLAPGGRWLVSTWAPLSQVDVCWLAHETITSLFPDDPPRFYETPFSYGDPSVFRELLVEAGFTEVAVETVRCTGRAESPRAAATGIVLGNPVGEQIRARDPSKLGEAIAAVEGALTSRYGELEVEAELEALIATAVV